MKLILPTTVLAVTVLCTQVQAGLFSFCRSNCGEGGQRCCQAECESVTVKKTCFDTECDEVVIPPVCIPSCKDLLKSICPGNGCCGVRSCGAKSCGAASCGLDGSCTASGCTNGCCNGNATCCPGNQCCGNGLLSKLFGKHAKCRVRCVNKLKEDSYESEEIKVKWKMQHRCGGCTECGDHCTQ